MELLCASIQFDPLATKDNEYRQAIEHKILKVVENLTFTDVMGAWETPDF